MNGTAQLAAVDLAREPPLSLGQLQLEPALRQVQRGAQRATLEPRIMQVLLVLSQADGRVVSRQELVDRCWGGRVVGDNAINRVISRLRQLSSTLGAGCFRIETIAKVGYRVVRVEPPASSAPDAGQPDAGPAEPSPVPASDRRRLLGTALALGAAAAGGVALTRWVAPAAPGGSEAEQLVQQARSALMRGTWDEVVQAGLFAERACELAPKQADAWGVLALARSFRTNGTVDAATLERDIARAQAAIGRALALQPDQPEALAATVMLKSGAGRWAEHEADLRQALHRHPDSGILRYLLGRTLAGLGRWQEACAIYRPAVRSLVDPLVAECLAEALWAAGRTGEAMDESARATAFWPAHPGLWGSRFRLLALNGQLAEASRLASEPEQDPGLGSPIPRDVALSLATALSASHPAAVDSALDAVRRARGEGRMASTLAAQFLAHLGASDAAFEMLDAYLLDRSAPGVPRPRPRRSSLVLFLPPLRGLWADARFGRLAASIGLEAYWQAGGRRPDFWPRA